MSHRPVEVSLLHSHCIFHIFTMRLVQTNYIKNFFMTQTRRIRTQHMNKPAKFCRRLWNLLQRTTIFFSFSFFSRRHAWPTIWVLYVMQHREWKDKRSGLEVADGAHIADLPNFIECLLKASLVFRVFIMTILLCWLNNEKYLMITKQTMTMCHPELIFYSL